MVLGYYVKNDNSIFFAGNDIPIKNNTKWYRDIGESKIKDLGIEIDSIANEEQDCLYAIVLNANSKKDQIHIEKKHQKQIERIISGFEIKDGIFLTLEKIRV